MDRNTSLIKNLQSFKQSLGKEIHISKMIFFGSRAKGNFKADSDIDLILVSKQFEGKKFRHRPLGFFKHWELEFPVDFLCYTEEEFNTLKDQITIVKEAVTEGIEID
ncbi:MAG: nucleotidyltransferase domain-containing protein [Candidatus Auribacterota bacterium]